MTFWPETCNDSSSIDEFCRIVLHRNARGMPKLIKSARSVQSKHILIGCDVFPATNPRGVALEGRRP